MENSPPIPRNETSLTMTPSETKIVNKGLAHGIRVYLLDGSYKTVRIDPNLNTIEELWEIVSEKLNLTSFSAQVFFLWAKSKDLELLLYTDSTISNVRGEWASLERKYNPRVNVITKTMSTLSFRNLGKEPFDIRKSNSDLPKLGQFEEDPFQFVFRTTSVLPLYVEKKCTDQGAINLFYIQAVYNVITSNYPSNKEIAVKLGGIQLQLTVGDQNPEIHKSGNLIESQSLKKYIPEHLLGTLKAEEWESNLFAEHLNHKGKDNNSLKLMYLDLVREWPYYGSTFFKARYIQNETFYKQDFEGQVRIGINGNGLHLISPKEMKVITYSYNELSTWDSEKGIFLFEVKEVEKGGLFKLKKKPTKLYQFKSEQADLINDLLCDWAEENDQKQRNSVEEKRRRKSTKI